MKQAGSRRVLTLEGALQFEEWEGGYTAPWLLCGGVDESNGEESERSTS